MSRFITRSLISLSALTLFACADPGCPEGTTPHATGRCVEVHVAPMEEPEDPERVDAAVPVPDAEAAFVVVEVMPSSEWIVRGESVAFGFSASTGPSFYGPLDYVVEGLPAGVSSSPSEDFSDGSLTLVAAADAPIGPPTTVTLRAFVADQPEIAGEAIFTLRVAGRPGTLDESFDGDGLRTDVPLDGTRDRVTRVGIGPEGDVVVAGNGRRGDFSEGFVSYYGADGLPLDDIADGGTRRVRSLGERITKIRDALPVDDGVLLAMEVAAETRLTRLDLDGNDDPLFAPAPAVASGSWTDGALSQHGDGFVAHSMYEIRRFRSDGSLDRDFGSAGVVDLPYGYIPESAVFADGSIVVASAVDTVLRFARFDASGQPHLGFGRRGVAEVPGFRTVRGIAPTGDGGFVVVSNTVTFDPTTQVPKVHRITADGALHAGFAVGGVLAHEDPRGGFAYAEGILVRGERIYTWGEHQGAIGPPTGYVAAHTLDGELDPSFGEGGVASLGDLVLPRDGAIDLEGRLVLGCDRPLSTESGAARMIAVARLWL